MKIIPYAQALVATINHLFVRGPEHSGKLFVVTVRIVVSDYSSDELKADLHRYVHLAVSADTNYVTVLAATTNSARPWLAVDSWLIVCRHDSAWRSDGVESTLKDANRDVLRLAEAHFQNTADELTESITIDSMAILDKKDVLMPELRELPTGKLQIS